MKIRIITFVICLVAILSTIAYAQKFNIINEKAEAEIFIDGKYIANKAVYDYEVEPGSHHIKVVLRGKTVFSKAVEIDFGMTKTINTDSFVEIAPSPKRLANRGARDVETSRIREARGNVAIGTQFLGINNGLSLKWFFLDNLGFQVVGWVSSDGDKRHDSIGGRLIFNIADTLAFNQIMSLYAVIGNGNMNNSFKDPAIKQEMTELMLGVEFPTTAPPRGGRDALANMFVAMLGGLDNLYINLEVGVETRTADEEQIYQGFRVNGGFHFYF